MGIRTGTRYTGNLTGQVGSLTDMFDTNLIAAGWSILSTATNERIYAPGSGTGFCLYVNDNGVVTGGAREAIVRLVDPSSVIGTLVDPCPLTTQVADNLCVWRKSDTLDATARAYDMVCDDRYLAMVVRFGTNNGDLYIAGDVEPFWTGDNYNAFINTRNIANNTGAALASPQVSTSNTGNGDTGCYFVRTASGTLKSEVAIMVGTTTGFGTFGTTTSAGDYPNPETLKLHLELAVVRGTGNTAVTTADSSMKRGALPFLWEPQLGQGITGMTPGQTFTDSAYDPASEFIIYIAGSTTSLTANADRWVLQIAGDWDPGY
jgi:hypothetical protein